MRKAPKRHRFTTERVRRTFQPPPKGAATASGKPITQALYWDEQTEGLGVVVSESNRSFVVQRWVDGNTKRVTLGRVNGRWKSGIPRTDDVCSLKAAREAARKIYASLGDGGPLPAAPAPLPTPTLREAIDLHTDDMRHKGSSERTIEDTRYVLRLHLEDWHDKRLADITKQMCKQRHKAITAEGKATTANRVFSRFRAVWNTAAGELDGIPDNPTIAVKWNDAGEARKPIAWADLPAWADKIDAVDNRIRKDLWWFVLLTGLRSEDARTVRWDHIDFEAGTVHRPKPKGGVNRAFTMPLSKPAIAILRRRKAENERDLGRRDGGWVWPSIGRDDKTTHLSQLKEQEYYVDAEDVRRKRNSMPSPHRLRHTFATAAHEAKVDPLDIKMLMNHTKPNSNKNVTQRYITPSVEHLREPVEQIAAFLLAKAGRGQ